jgi:hypothetical protein
MAEPLENVVKLLIYNDRNGGVALMIFPRPQVVDYLFDDFIPPGCIYGRDTTAALGQALLSGHHHRHPPQRKVMARGKPDAVVMYPTTSRRPAPRLRAV